MSTRRFALLGAALTGVVACGDPPAGQTYFDHFIQPVLVQNCAQNVSGCHRINEGDELGRAAGNLDVTTFERISKRRDLLQSFGAYSYPALLIKASSQPVIAGVNDNALPVNYNGTSLDLQVAHNGQGVLDISSPAFDLLLGWTDNGATESGLRPPAPPQTSNTPCSTFILPEYTPADLAAAMTEPGFATFRDQVQPIIDRKGCAAGICHGAPQADFYITCGDANDQIAFNYKQAHAFVGLNMLGEPEGSQILIVPLAASAGGIGHTGGDQFSSRNDPDYVTVREWARGVGPIVFGAGDAGRTFFAKHVQPIFLLRGCAFMNCHSPGATNDFKLRSGSQGFFSSLALEKNYDLLRQEFMALEYPDARRGRIVSKNILPAAGGIKHRGGPVLETVFKNVGTYPCPPYNPATYNPATDNYVDDTPYCSIQTWVDIERLALIAAGQVDPLAPNDQVQIVYVDRPGGGPGDTLLEFDNYRPGSDLLIATSTLTGPDRHLSAAGGATSLLTSCGVGAGAADIRAPEVNPAGTQVVFAMRVGAGEGLQIWKVNTNSTGCVRVTMPQAPVNGIAIHNFDPVWSPDGQSIVFASTRGGTGGPSRARSPGFQPQSDIWRMGADGSNPEQVTFLSNSEITPAFMREGRITMTTEKVYIDPNAKQGPGVFQQLSGRRINWDRTDYHPLLAQRAQSPYGSLADLTVMRPTVDYSQATEIRERSNGDFVIILSDVGANGGGGALATFNRSAGPFETGRFNMDPAQGDPSFLESLVIADPGADMGRLTSTTAYRGTFGLPDGEILGSYANLGGTLDSATNINWDVVSVAIDPVTHAATRTTIIGGGGAQMDAVLVVKRPPGVLFYNKRQLVFGGRTDMALAGTMHAHVHFPDAPMVFTLFTGNLRRGRPVDAFRDATQIAFYREGRQTGTTANMMGIYQMRTLIGKAPLAADGSTRVDLPAGEGVVMELQNAAGGVVVAMGEEHQFGPGEVIALGIQESLFDAACGGCHGSVSASELDNATKPDVLTGASASMSETIAPMVPR